MPTPLRTVQGQAGSNTFPDLAPQGRQYQGKKVDTYLRYALRVLLCLTTMHLWNAMQVSATTSLQLQLLGRPGPWGGISGLIPYGDRLYVVNSRIFANHNSADIYRYDPTHRTFHFARRLFSQDAGTPAVIDGLLYWPYEDPRFSTTYGEYAMTDGQRWRWHVARDLRGFHVHALGTHAGAMYALASGWRGRIYRSTDQGHHWALLYEHPTPNGKVSRVTGMVAQGATLYFALTAWAEEGPKLLLQNGGAVTTVPEWPSGRSIGALCAFHDGIFAVNRTENSSRLWHRTASGSVYPVTALDRYSVIDCATTPESLWVVTNAASGGLLWHSHNGQDWQQVQRFPERPVEVTVAHGQLFVGTFNQDQGGGLWGPDNTQPFPVPADTAALPLRKPHIFTSTALTQALRQLDDALTDVTPTTYRQRVLAALLPLAISHDPAAGHALAARLHRPIPRTLVSLIGGKVRRPAADIARWYLLHAVAQNGHGHVPPALLTIPWSSPPNSSEKYLEPSIAAAWAVSQLHQDDPATLTALRQALRGNTFPDAERGDLRAALHVLTGRPFRYPER